MEGSSKFVITSFHIGFLIILNLQSYSVVSKNQFVQPILMGMQVAIPYDIANIWNRPVSFAPFLSTFCGLTILYFLFFGVITSPFGYMFGVPSQKYVIGTNGTDTFFNIMTKLAEEMHSETSFNAHTTGEDARSLAVPLIRKVIQYQWQASNFSESVFKYFANTEFDDINCQQLILCHAHSTLRRTLPEVATPLYRVFSKTLTNVTAHQRKAITVGLGTHNNCEEVFQECSSDIYSITLRILLNLLPEMLRRNLQEFCNGRKE